MSDPPGGELVAGAENAIAETIRRGIGCRG